MTTLIVEDGTGVENANSYVTVDEARSYAKARDYSFTDADDKLARYLIQGMDYLEALRDQYRGKKSASSNALQWPRRYVTIDGFCVEPTTIPNELKQAQIRLAMSQQDGLDLMPTSSGDAFVVSERVGPIETKYSEGVSTSGIPIVRSVDALLAPLMHGNGLISTARA